MPLVSIIIPTYNRANFLLKTIQSIFKQTFKDFELIVINDGSDDNTREIIDSLNYKIHYYFQKNRGVSAARNVGIKSSDCKWFAFLDSDDLWRKKKLQIQMERIQQDQSIKICYTNEKWLRNGQHLNQKKKHQKYSGWILEKMLPLCLISPSSVVIAREVFDEVGLFDESLPACEDYDLWLRIGIRYPITFIDQPLIIKQGGHADQLSHKFWGIDRFRIKALEKLLQNPDLKNEQRPQVIKVLQQKCQIVAHGALKRGKKEEAENYLKLAEKYQLKS